MTKKPVSNKKSGKAAGKMGKTVLLSGGNPQIAKADGDAAVQQYIAAMPGWKKAMGFQLDKLIEQTIPGVVKAVKWNSPFYGVEGNGWFLSFHCFAKYIKLAFFKGAELQPPPPIASTQVSTRYFHIYEKDTPDEQQLANWIQQASQLPGWTP